MYASTRAHIHNAKYRFGSAGFASLRDLKRAAMLEAGPESLLVGFAGKKPITYSGAGGVILVAGARSGKLRDMLAYNICAGLHPGTMVMLDVKGELAAISRDQTPDNKFCIYWNPLGLHDLPKHRINPLGFIRADSPTLHGDVKIFIQNAIPKSGAPQSEFFELRAREFLEGICLTLVRLTGILTYPDLYDVINLIPGNGDAWLDFAWEMNQSGFAISQRIEEEIAESRNDSTGGFRGILGELFKSFSALSDPVLLDSVSPPYDFDLSQLCESDQRYNFYMMPPAEMLETWGPVLKSFFVGAMIHKSRKPSAPRQTWIIDEAAQLQKFPLLVSLFTIGAGIGIRPIAVFQSSKQMKALGPDAEDIITSSAQCRIYFGVRDEPTAALLSRMIGSQTLHYRDKTQDLKIEQARRQMAHAMLNGQDPIGAALQHKYQMREADLARKQERKLMTPDEIMTLSDKAIVFADDLPGPALLDRRAYYDQRFMAGRFHPNPYHPPLTRVRVKAWWGYKWKRVVTAPVEAEYAHYPQYADGLRSRIET